MKTNRYFLTNLFIAIVACLAFVGSVNAEPGAPFWSNEIFDYHNVRITPSGQMLPLQSGYEAQAVSGSTIPLLKINDHLYQTEHCLFIIDTSGRINWPQYDSVYSQENIAYYLNELQANFPEDFFSVTILANELTPNWVPVYYSNRYKAEGIGLEGDVGVPDICKYNIGGGNVGEGALGVFDHEIGHAWGVYIAPSTEGGICKGAHWLANSTVWCQMGWPLSFDDYKTQKRLLGDEIIGFHCEDVDINEMNETRSYSGQQLYLMGLNPTFPTLYVLNDIVCNPDNTVSYSSLTKYDHASVVSSNGPRIPDYRSSQKHFELAFIYVARDLNEVMTVYQGIEQSINQFCYAEQNDMGLLRFSIPFLVNTLFRGSVDARLADLDGNAAPQLSIGSQYISSSTGTATIPFTAQDPDGPSPAISCVPSSANCSIVGNNVVVQGLPNGAHFFTIKAEDDGQKKAFAHFVVDVTKPEQETVSAPEVPYGPTICLMGDTYSYTISRVASTLGHGVEYRFDWGDGTYSDWAASSNFSKTWTVSGTHLVRAQARCTSDHVESNYSIGLVVYVPPKSDQVGTFSNITDTCIRANVNFVNPEGTQYYFENTVAHTNSGLTANVYWDSCGLTCGTTYTFWMQATYPDGSKSWWYFVGDQSTQACSPFSDVPWGYWADYNGDGTTDVAAFHLPTDQFFTDYSGNLGQFGWGGSDSMPLIWDYDGDGKTDVSIYHIPTNQWFVKGVGNLGQFGWGGEESIPVPGDYNGDGRMERAFYHSPSNRWFVEGQDPVTFGWNGTECIPLPGDYDGDGKTDMVIYHIPTNQWFQYGVGNLGQFGWGGADCIPVPGDYNGDGKTEIAVYHVPTNQWFVKGIGNLGQYGWGGLESFPIPGDYDGDGVMERGFYRPSENRWFIEGENNFVWGWGGSDFMPITSSIAVYNWFRFMLGKFQ